MTGLIKSPCIGVCKVNEQINRCIGCGRSIDQITNWINYDEEKKRVITDLAKNNLKKSLNNCYYEQ